MKSSGKSNKNVPTKILVKYLMSRSLESTLHSLVKFKIIKLCSRILGNMVDGLRGLSRIVVINLLKGTFCFVGNC